jgi:hypothetical protein
MRKLLALAAIASVLSAGAMTLVTINAQPAFACGTPAAGRHTRRSRRRRAVARGSGGVPRHPSNRNPPSLAWATAADSDLMAAGAAGVS